MATLVNPVIWAALPTIDLTEGARVWKVRCTDGAGNPADTNRPVSVASNVVAVAAGGAHSLFLKSDGTLWSMGYNLYGQLGIGNPTDTNRPVCVASNVVVGP